MLPMLPMQSMHPHMCVQGMKKARGGAPYGHTQHLDMVLPAGRQLDQVRKEGGLYMQGSSKIETNLLLRQKGTHVRFGLIVGGHLQSVGQGLYHVRKTQACSRRVFSAAQAFQDSLESISEPS